MGRVIKPCFVCLGLLAGCGDEQPMEYVACVRGPDVAGASSSFEASVPGYTGTLLHEGTGTVTQLEPQLEVDFNGGSVSVFGVDSGLQVGDVVQVNEASSFYPPFSSAHLLLSDAGGLRVAAWSASTWNGDEIPDWSLTYKNDQCGDHGGSAIDVDSNTPTKTLTATNAGAKVTLSNGTHSELGDYIVTNGYSHGSSRPDKSPTRHQGSIVRKHL